jgi:hypothetical protein
VKVYSANKELGRIVVERFNGFVDNLNRGIYEPTIRSIPCDKCRFRSVCPYFGKPVEPIRLSLSEVQRPQVRQCSGSNGAPKSKVVGEAVCPICGSEGGVYIALRSSAYYLYMLHGPQKHYVGRASEWVSKLTWRERDDEVLRKMGLPVN